jgi:hypothetical protein
VANVETFYEPSKLFRYRSFRSRAGSGILDREIGMIEGRYLHCAGFEDLNDPMEGTFSVPEQRWPDPYSSERWVDSALQTIRAGKSLTKICSFSETHDHDVMWAHYADQFAGMCIEYDLSKLLKELPDDMNFTRLFYSDKQPEVGQQKAKLRDANKVLSFKSQKWLYEREWRLFSRTEIAEYRSVDCVSAVYLGSRCSAGDSRDVFERVRRIQVPVKIMKLEKYSIEFESLNR